MPIANKTFTGAGEVVFAGSAVNYGSIQTASVTFEGYSVNEGPIDVTDEAVFNDYTRNLGEVECDIIQILGNAANEGSLIAISTLTMAGNSTNSGSIQSGVAVFGGNVVVNGEVVAATITVSGNAVNNADVVATVSIQFLDSSSNTATITGTAIFRGTAINQGIVDGIAEFYDTAANDGGTITGNAEFYDSAANDGGTIEGNAVFADTTSNTGTVQGDAQVAATATNTGTVQGNETEYTGGGGGGGGGEQGTPITLNGTNYYLYGNILKDGSQNIIADGSGFDTSALVKWSTDSNGVYSAISLTQTTLAGTSYYTGGNVLYDTSGNTVNSSFIYDSSTLKFINTNNSGEMTIIENINLYSINSYNYYATSLSNGNTLYNSSGSVAVSLSPAWDSSNGIIFSTDASGILSVSTNVSTISLNNTNYLIDGPFANGSTLYDGGVYTKISYASTNYDSTQGAFWYTDGNGVLIVVVATSITLNGTGYYHTGSFSSGSTLYDSSMSPISMAGGFDSTSNTIWSTDNMGVLTTISVTPITLGGNQYYHTGGSFGNGVTLYGSSYVIANDVSNLAYNESVVSTDGSGVVTIS